MAAPASTLRHGRLGGGQPRQQGFNETPKPGSVCSVSDLNNIHPHHFVIAGRPISVGDGDGRRAAHTLLVKWQWSSTIRNFMLSKTAFSWFAETCKELYVV